jgi:hypothetical protein
MKFRAYDKPLLHNLELIDDWEVFGTIKFNEPTSNKKCLKIWYNFIRQVELRNKGQWVAKIEGDNTLEQQLEGTTRHIHFLLAKEGTKEKNYLVKHILSILNLMSDLKPFWATRPSFPYGVRKTMSTASFKVEPYDSDRGARLYISKICNNDTVNLNTKGFDSGEYCCWKLSHRLKSRMTKLNEKAEVIAQRRRVPIEENKK